MNKEGLVIIKLKLPFLTNKKIHKQIKKYILFIDVKYIFYLYSTSNFRPLGAYLFFFCYNYIYLFLFWFILLHVTLVSTRQQRDRQ